MLGHQFGIVSRCAAILMALTAVPLTAFGQTASGEKSPATTLDYQRDIQPILSEKCWHCHGQDEASRQGGLRLDQATAALAGGDSGRVIAPGNAAQSELVRRITSDDSALVMPPPEEKKPLTAAEQAKLRAWIDQGAEFSTHWAFAPPVQHPVPSARPAADDLAANDFAANENPIDAWVESGWAGQGLVPAPHADSSVLCRRLYLDLIGLPPSPEQFEQYERLGHDATVERLLASPRFGEKWARHWLDVARYSDTNGYEKDLPREQWIWRDWVIKALNADMPYDQFVIEQIAGDLLPDATQDQIVATGFLRNSMLNEEGAIVPEQFRMVEMFDRIDCIGKAVMGLTTQCAQCHSHKFDPLTQTEYFGMFAFLNNSYEAQSYVYDAQQQRTIADIHGKIAALVDAAKKQIPDWQAEFEKWSQSVSGAQADWQPVEFDDLGSNSGLNHPTQLEDRSILMLGHASGDVYMLGKPDLAGATGLRLEGLTHGDLPHRGPGRSKLGTWTLLELEAFVKTPGSRDWQKIKLVDATADYSKPEPPPAGEEAGKNKKRFGPVAYLIDGSDDTGWQGDRGPGIRNQASVAVVRFEKPLEAPAGSELKIALRSAEMLGCARISLTKSPAPRAAETPHAAILALERPADQRSDEDRSALELAWISSRLDCRSIADQIAALWAKTPAGFTTVLHLSERTGDAQRITHLLDRGEWNQPKQAVEPHTPQIFHPLGSDQPRNRLGFARWLVDRRSPLAARVAVNRLWQAVFGEGLVETAEDFGTRAPVPEHRELFDWLAVDFMEHGWSQKRILQLIVTSQTYQRSSQVTEELLQRDPRNRLLARGPRFRADAEVVRDIALSVSGLLTHQVGGPSVIPPVPKNVLDYNYTYPSYWTPADGAQRYRRTLYGFRKRSMPDPVMSSFDAPNGDFACARRTRSNTPMAALTGLNETIFFECAQALGLRIVRESQPDDALRADTAFQLCTGRLPQPHERQEVLRFLDACRNRLADGWLNPREIISGDPGPLPQLPSATTPQTAAAWILVARVLLNLDETLTKN